MTFGMLPRTVLLLLALLSIGSPAEAQEALTYWQARTAMDAAELEARTNEWNLTILIADADGVPIYMRRMDGASQRTVEIATRKVLTALASGMATGDYGRALEAGRVEEVPNGVTFEGGYPIVVDGEIVGAMSASGASGADDAQAVRAGLTALGITP